MPSSREAPPRTVAAPIALWINVRRELMVPRGVTCDGRSKAQRNVFFHRTEKNGPDEHRRATLIRRHCTWRNEFIPPEQESAYPDRPQWHLAITPSSSSGRLHRLTQHVQDPKLLAPAISQKFDDTNAIALSGTPKCCETNPVHTRT